MKVLLKQEWTIDKKPVDGLVKAINKFRDECLLIDTLKLYDKVRNKSFIYTCENGRVRELELPLYRKLKAK